MSGRTVTVALPMAEGPDADGQLWLAELDVRVDLTGEAIHWPPVIYLRDREISASSARETALALLAAAQLVEEAGGQ